MRSVSFKPLNLMVILSVFSVFILNGCSLSVEITSNHQASEAIKKAKGAELTSGTSRQTTARGYVIDSQVGTSLGAVVSKTDKNYTVYHSVKMGISAE